jgi:hypothetical protein
MATYGFHSEATEEYLAATQYYLDHASPLVDAAFVAAVESRNPDPACLSYSVGSNRRAADPSLSAHAVSLFNLLPVGSKARSRFHLRGNAF